MTAITMPKRVNPRVIKAKTSGGVFPGSNGPFPPPSPMVLLDVRASGAENEEV